MTDPQVFLDNYIIPAATALNICTVPHLQIGLGTGIQESGLKNVQQIGGGPALGPFQMEPATHDSLQRNFIAYKPAVRSAMIEILGSQPAIAGTMMNDLIYAAFMMFCKYLDCPGAIPADLAGQAAYYKKWYNSPLGAATEQQYIDNWNRHALGVRFTAQP